MTDHGQLDQDPQIVAFSPELLKLADRRRGARGGGGAAPPRAGLPPEASYSTTMTPPAECA